MSNHGVVAYGVDLHSAYMKMETVEHFAQISLVTHLLGRQQPLGSVELGKLMAARSKYQGSTSSAPLPLAVPCDEEGDFEHSQPREEAPAPVVEQAATASELAASLEIGLQVEIEIQIRGRVARDHTINFKSGGRGRPPHIPTVLCVTLRRSGISRRRVR